MSQALRALQSIDPADFAAVRENHVADHFRRKEAWLRECVETHGIAEDEYATLATERRLVLIERPPEPRAYRGWAIPLQTETTDFVYRPEEGPPVVMGTMTCTDGLTHYSFTVHPPA